MRTVVRQVGGTLAFVAIVGAFAYGVYGMATYAYPLWNNNFRGALKSRVTDPTEVFLNGAAKSYEEGKVDEAR
ncbi:MAG: hypothetical protein K2Z81_06600, partial [Cyanobacteria bacterium]|nr:hypothetical protein [Cyanobacteriota bacterium]